MQPWVLILIAIIFNPTPVARAALLDAFPNYSTLKIVATTFFVIYFPWMFFNELSTIDFNFRFATSSTAESLISKVETILKKHQLDYEIFWNQGGEPFLTPKGTLCDALTAAIQDELGITPTLSTTGGTSDGRFIAKICPQVVEFGPINASIHKVNENVNLNDIESLKNIYLRTLKALILN